MVIFSQCHKKKDPIPAVIAHTDVCTPELGNHTYVPLAVGNSWTYGGVLFPITSTVVKDTVAFGNKYFVAKYIPSGFISTSYQRYNSNGDLVVLDSLAYGKSTEALVIQGTPSTGTPYTSQLGTSTVISTNASLNHNTTGGTCDYTGLLQIEVLQQHRLLFSYQDHT